MKINNFQGKLTDISAKKAALMHNPCHQSGAPVDTHISVQGLLKLGSCCGGLSDASAAVYH